jgi:hypothetical protein
VFCCAVIIIISSSCIIKGTRGEYYHPPKLQINSESRGVTSSGPRVVAMATAPSLSRSHTFSAPLSITRQHQVRASFLPNKVERINFSCRQLGAWKNVDNAAIKSESIPTHIAWVIFSHHLQNRLAADPQTPGNVILQNP